MWPFLVIFFFVFAYNNTRTHRLENCVCVLICTSVWYLSERAAFHIDSLVAHLSPAFHGEPTPQLKQQPPLRNNVIK